MHPAPAPPASAPAPAPPPPAFNLIEIVEPDAEDCQHGSLPPEGNVKLRNYRVLSDSVRAYTPTGDIHTSPLKGKLVSRYDVCADISPPRARILELVGAGDPGRDALEAIVRPASRRGLARPLDDDTRRFLQRAMLSPSPQGLSAGGTPEPYQRHAPPPRSREPTPDPGHTDTPEPSPERSPKLQEHPVCVNAQRSLAEELREAEEWSEGAGEARGAWARDGAGGGAAERERLGKLALSVEEDEEESGGRGGRGGGCEGQEALSAAGRRLDALLAESRELQAELVGISEDLQTSTARVSRCVAVARALGAESQALRYLDDVVALLRGDLAGAVRAGQWPFARGARDPQKNYVV